MKNLSTLLVHDSISHGTKFWTFERYYTENDEGERFWGKREDSGLRRRHGGYAVATNDDVCRSRTIWCWFSGLPYTRSAGYCCGLALISPRLLLTSSIFDLSENNASLNKSQQVLSQRALTCSILGRSETHPESFVTFVRLAQGLKIPKKRVTTYVSECNFTNMWLCDGASVSVG